MLFHVLFRLVFTFSVHFILCFFLFKSKMQLVCFWEQVFFIQLSEYFEKCYLG